MYFLLKDENGFVPELQYGVRGQELACFVPDGYSWHQLNYGQGEGQVVVDGCEWGFYYADSNSIGVVLHDGCVDLYKATVFINLVKNKIFGEKAESVSVFLKSKDE